MSKKEIMKVSLFAIISMGLVYFIPQLIGFVEMSATQNWIALAVLSLCSYIVITEGEE